MSTQLYGRSPTRDKLECGCEVDAQARIDTLVLTRATQLRKGKQTGNMGTSSCPSNGGTIQLREDQQELRIREQKNKAKDARRIRGTVHENDKNKRTVTCKMKWRNSCITMSRNCSACGEGWHCDDKKGGWVDTGLCAKARREEVEYIRCHKMHTRVPGEVCLRATEKALIRTGWAETDKGQPGKPNVRARWVAKEYTTYASPELYASTPPLEALKVVLSEIATGERGGKFLALVNVRREYFYAPARRRVFVELPSEDHQAGDEHVCELQYSLYGARDAAQNWQDELASTLGDLKLTRGIACPCVCVERLHQGQTYRGNTGSVENDRWWNSSSK